MNNFEFYNPVHIIFGENEINRVGKEARLLGKKALLVSYSEHVFFDELIRKIKQLLREEGVEVEEFFGVSPNPKIGEVETGIKLCKKAEADFIIGLGGGSAMDAAKMIAAGGVYPGNVWDMVYSRHDNTKNVIPPDDALPTLMIPTLPATGSEMNPTAVITNEKTNEKSYTWAPCLYPKVSIVDPSLTCSLPPYQTACAAADTISHVLEFYINGFEDAYLNNRIQESVMLTTLEYAPVVLANPFDVAARGQLQWAAILALNGLSQPGDGWTPMHQLGHVLSAKYSIAHGASLTIVMPAWMKYYYRTRLTQYVQFSTRVFGIAPAHKTLEEIALEGIFRMDNLFKEWGLSTRLKDIGVNKEEIPALADQVVKISFGADGYLRSRPPASRNDVEEVFKLAFY